MSSVLVSPRNRIALARQNELDFECLINGAVVEGCLALRDARNVTSCRLRGAVGSDERQQNEQTKHFENSTSLRSQWTRVRNPNMELVKNSEAKRSWRFVGNPEGPRKSLRWFPLMRDTYRLYQASPARKSPANAGTLDLKACPLIRTCAHSKKLRGKSPKRYNSGAGPLFPQNKQRAAPLFSF